MPTPIRMVPLEALSHEHADWSSLAVLAIPVSGDGIWLEGVTAEQCRTLAAAIEEHLTPSGWTEMVDALRKAAGA